MNAFGLYLNPSGETLLAEAFPARGGNVVARLLSLPQRDAAGNLSSAEGLPSRLRVSEQGMPTYGTYLLHTPPQASEQDFTLADLLNQPAEEPAGCSDLKVGDLLGMFFNRLLSDVRNQGGQAEDVVFATPSAWREPLVAFLRHHRALSMAEVLTYEEAVQHCPPEHLPTLSAPTDEGLPVPSLTLEVGLRETRAVLLDGETTQETRLPIGTEVYLTAVADWLQTQGVDVTQARAAASDLLPKFAALVEARGGLKDSGAKVQTETAITHAGGLAVQVKNQEDPFCLEETRNTSFWKEVEATEDKTEATEAMIPAAEADATSALTTPDSAQESKCIEMDETIYIRDFARRLGIELSDVLACLAAAGLLGTLFQTNKIDADQAILVAEQYGFKVRVRKEAQSGESETEIDTQEVKQETQQGEQQKQITADGVARIMNVGYVKPEVEAVSLSDRQYRANSQALTLAAQIDELEAMVRAEEERIRELFNQAKQSKSEAETLAAKVEKVDKLVKSTLSIPSWAQTAINSLVKSMAEKRAEADSLLVAARTEQKKSWELRKPWKDRLAVLKPQLEEIVKLLGFSAATEWRQAEEKRRQREEAADPSLEKRAGLEDILADLMAGADDPLQKAEMPSPADQQEAWEEAEDREALKFATPSTARAGFGESDVERFSGKILQASEVTVDAFALSKALRRASAAWSGALQAALGEVDMLDLASVAVSGAPTLLLLVEQDIYRSTGLRPMRREPNVVTVPPGLERQAALGAAVYALRRPEGGA